MLYIHIPTSASISWLSSGDLRLVIISRKGNRNQGDRLVVEEVSEKSSDNDSDDGDDDDNEASAKTDDHKKPEMFQQKSNSEIVTWLVSNPEILRLANQMVETNESLGTSSKITDVSIKSI